VSRVREHSSGIARLLVAHRLGILRTQSDAWSGSRSRPATGRSDILFGIKNKDGTRSRELAPRISGIEVPLCPDFLICPAHINSPRHLAERQRCGEGGWICRRAVTAHVFPDGIN
jgi:hypothetical protein